MSHVRQQIREAAATTVTGLAVTGSNVFPSRVYPHDVVPSLSVYTLTDTVDADQSVLGAVGYKQVRELELVIEARSKLTANVDNQLDDIAADVEIAMQSDVTLGGLCEWLELTDTAIELEAESENPAGLARLTYSVIYRVAANNPQLAIS